MHLRDYNEYIKKDNTLVIRTAPKTKFGISNVYNEIDIPLYSKRVKAHKCKRDKGIILALTKYRQGFIV